MLNAINLALNPWTIASVTVSERGVVGLTFRSTQLGSEGVAIELDRMATAKLVAVLDEAKRQSERGLILTVDLMMVGLSEDQLARKNHGIYELPY